MAFHLGKLCQLLIHLVFLLLKLLPFHLIVTLPQIQLHFLLLELRSQPHPLRHHHPSIPLHRRQQSMLQSSQQRMPD
ncbi:hypothetical protein LA22_02115 [Xanthomonas oryzae pv. oryzae]|nr:hypothetical protein IXO222_19710 [Xanthomonas oryzae pv. oryzae]OLK01301.1 hypothetical protein IXO599_20725 [Xanthomonas oryzae pv. oryzae]OLK16259.1 hypothetical protein IXO621_20265 [Xanthomonas oryzae pv. oryzae]PNR71904.1 hypothetical protein LA20_01815 [Xanthomonas oryzae pv. oryzae]PNR77640.1 hypothetical protein LA21_02025 [Xanthomonas oryzae pv. oryzae]